MQLTHRLRHLLGWQPACLLITEKHLPNGVVWRTVTCWICGRLAKPPDNPRDSRRKRRRRQADDRYMRDYMRLDDAERQAAYRRRGS